MQRRLCGDSGLSVPILGIGCWSFGGGSYWGKQDQRDTDRVVATALERGCNYFDTAEVYNDGESELALGRALAGRRTAALVGTKVSPQNATRVGLRNHCEASLRRLGTEYIDLYMIHWPINEVSLRHFTDDTAVTENPPDIQEAIEGIELLKKEGKIRHGGVSNFGPEQIGELVGAGFSPACNQLCYNLLSRAIEYEILRSCADNRIGVFTYMPLLQGLLTGSYRNIDDIHWQRTRTRHFRGDRQDSRHGEPGVEDLLTDTLSKLLRLAEELGQPLRAIALAWLMRNNEVCCTINGVRSIAQLEENIVAAELELSSSTFEELNVITDQLKEAMGSSPDYYESQSQSRSF